MSLVFDGVFAGGLFDPQVWAQDVWYEPASAPSGDVWEPGVWGDGVWADGVWGVGTTYDRLLWNVDVTLVDQDSEPMVGVVIDARLDMADKCDNHGLQVKPVEVITDASGNATLALMANATGEDASQYVIKATDSTGAKEYFRVTAIVPKADVNLFDIATSLPC